MQTVYILFVASIVGIDTIVPTAHFLKIVQAKHFGAEIVNSKYLRVIYTLCEQSKKLPGNT